MDKKFKVGDKVVITFNRKITDRPIQYIVMECHNCADGSYSYLVDHNGGDLWQAELNLKSAIEADKEFSIYKNERIALAEIEAKKILDEAKKRADAILERAINL